MSTPEGFPDGSPGEARPNAPLPLLTDEVIPGYGFATDPPIADGRRVRLNERLDKIDAVATDTFQKLAAPVAERLDRVNQCAVETEAKLRGSLNSRLDRIQRVYDKVAGKLLGRMRERLGNSYAYAAQAGAGFPNDAQVVTGLQTGDYLGTTPGKFYTGSDATAYTDSSDSAPAIDTGQETTPTTTGGGFSSPPTYTPPPVVPSPPTSPGPVTRVDWQPGIHPFPGVDNSQQCYNAPAAWGWIDAPPKPWWPPDLLQQTAAHPFTHLHWPVAIIPEGGTCTIGSEMHCIDACHFGLEAGTGHVRVCAPPNTAIYINPTTGEIIATADTGQYSSEGWVFAFAGDCNTPQIFPVSGGPPVLPPTQPPTDGQQCKEVCPVPGPLDCGPKPVFPKPKPPDPNDDVCDGIEAALDNLNFDLFAPWQAFAMAYGKVTDCGQATGAVDALISRLLGSNEPVIPALVNRFGKWLKSLAESLAKGINCDRDAAGKLSVVLGALNFVQQWTSIVPKPLLADLQQAQNFACQTQLPGGSQADATWLANEINDHVWECWHKAAGDHLKQAAKVRDAQRNRLGASAAAVAFRKGYITRERFDKIMRAAGVINDDDKGEIWQMTEWWPAASNVIRYMGKDAFDEAAVTKFRLMEGFPEKFSERAKHFADGAGVDEEIMRAEWVSHWQTVGFNTMASAMQRLRPGVAPPGLETTAQDVKESLLQQDYPPYWVDRMVALGYRVLTRIDATRAFNIRVLDEDGLKGAFLDEGNTEVNADILVKFYKEKRRIAELKASGMPTLRTAVNMYARSEMTPGELEGIILQVSASEEQAAAAMEAADDAKHIRRRTQGMKGIKKDYVAGLLDDGEAAALLAQFDVDSSDVGPLITEWAFDRAARGKHASAEKLCKWYGMGLITRPLQLRALVRLGWSPEDALRITKECDYELAEKERKALEAAMKKAEAQQKKTAAAMKRAATIANGQAANGELVPT